MLMSHRSLLYLLSTINRCPQSYCFPPTVMSLDSKFSPQPLQVYGCFNLGLWLETLSLIVFKSDYQLMAYLECDCFNPVPITTDPTSYPFWQPYQRDHVLNEHANHCTCPPSPMSGFMHINIVMQEKPTVLLPMAYLFSVARVRKEDAPVFERHSS